MPPRKKKDETVLLEDYTLIFKNFEGKEGQYNRKGDRNFAVLLDVDTANRLDRDGWNVKALKAREEGDPEQPYLPVSVNFSGRPPHIVMITSRGRTELDEAKVEMLDWADIETVDLIINPYNWEVNGKSGKKAYLKSMFVTIREDALDLKYAHIDDVPARAGRTDENFRD